MEQADEIMMWMSSFHKLLDKHRNGDTSKDEVLQIFSNLPQYNLNVVEMQVFSEKLRSIVNFTDNLKQLEYHDLCHNIKVQKDLSECPPKKRKYKQDIDDDYDPSEDSGLEEKQSPQKPPIHKKKYQVCNNCGNSGHNVRTCAKLKDI